MNPNTSCISGILYGTMTMELGGKVTIACEKNKLQAELDFKLKVKDAACGRQCLELRVGGRADPLLPHQAKCPKQVDLCIPTVRAQGEKRLPTGHTAEPAGLSAFVLMVKDYRFESRLRHWSEGIFF